MLDREPERGWLQRHLQDERAVLVLYGRRRVGKTTLVTTVLDELNFPSVYYLCDKRGTAPNARAFAARCADELDDVEPAVDGFTDAFEYLATRVDGPFVVALDEFSYLVEADNAVPSAFQGIVDEVLDGTDISLVLLGSSISMMEEEVLGYESPLYGRRTGQWRLEPMTVGEAAGFLSNYGPVEMIRAYGAVGGVPAYLDQFDAEVDLLTNVERHILTKGAYLYEEPEFLLRQELREPATYMAILEAIAMGATRVTEIATEIDRNASSLSRYLQNLERLAIVERERPVTDPNDRGVYRVTDHFLRFWFRYVLPNRSTLEQGHTTPVLDAIDETLPSHTSWTFEAVCRQSVRTPAFPVNCARVGRWWYEEQEIDVAGLNDDTNTLLLGECKWTTDTVGVDLLDDLEALQSDVRWHGSDRTVVYALFAKTGFTRDLRTVASERADVHLFEARDVFSLF